MAYASGSGGDTLTFEYTVRAGDGDDDGVWLQAPSNLLVELEDGATLTWGASASNALRTKSGLSTTGDPNHKVDSPGDYDSDNDGFIEVSNASQLNAMRWDLDGDGTPATANQSGYTAAFPNPQDGMGCKRHRRATTAPAPARATSLRTTST